jgi:mannan endo-1,4-beta-mannosidase
VNGFQKEGDRIVWQIPQAQAGIYEVRIRYSSPGDEKGYELVVNGSKTSGMFMQTGDAFNTRNAGKVELRQGANTVAIEKGWGYYDIDAIDIVPATIDAALKKPSKTLVDPRASAKTRALHSYLIELYGEKMLSGQYEEAENNYIHSVTGQTPAILGGDFMDYSPSRIARGTKPEGTTERLIQKAREGQIITMAWHWNAPKDLLDKEYTNESGQKIDARWYKGFYTNATTFDLERALANPQSEDYKLLLRDMDVIAAELKKFADADIPVLWRPLYEAEGRWFWWGAKGPGPLVQLWRLMFDRMTNHHGLHNLIWVYTIGNKPEWYPGDNYVDMVGIDAYPSDPFDPLSSTWDELKQRFDGKKLMALTEIGKVPDVEKMWRYGVRWSHFVSWTGDLGPQKVSKEDLSRIYKSDVVLNREELRPITVTSAQTVPPAGVPLVGSSVPANAASYLRVASEVENNLQQHVLSKWFPAAVDRERGGFFQNFAEDWTRQETTEKSIVYQSRLTWMAAQEAMRSPQTVNTYREHSRHGLKFLNDVLWDKQHGGFFWAVDRNGQPGTERGREKHVYGISFGIYAAAANYKATRDAQALDLAKRAFNWLEAHAHDARNGGYYEALTSAGQPILVPPVTPSGSKVMLSARAMATSR